MVRKAETLSGLDDLKLSKRTQSAIERRGMSPDEMVLWGRKTYLVLAFGRLKGGISMWDQELLSALNEAGFIRHDIDLRTWRVWGLYSAILSTRSGEFVGCDPITNEEFEKLGFIRRDSFTNGDYEMLVLVSDADYSKIRTALSSLKERERDVIERRFGLCAIRPASLEDIGKIYSVTTERVRQIEAKALRKLRHQNRLSKLPPLFGFVPPEDPEAKLAEQIGVGPADPETSIDSLGLTVRTRLCLERRGITTVGGILDLSSDDLRRVRNLGRKSQEEVISRIRQIGYPEFSAE